jgi:predicted RNase H-like nuclease (RuvC/YqgF family)
MVPEESKAQVGNEEKTQPARDFKRPRRSGRGRRGRGGRRPIVQADPATQSAADTSKSEVSEQEQSPTSYATPVSSPNEPHRLEESGVASASPGNIQQAIGEVNQIIERLRETLDEMEEVLETLELAERQKDADEREIEELRRALRNLQRPREGQRRPD